MPYACAIGGSGGPYRPARYMHSLAGRPSVCAAKRMVWPINVAFFCQMS